MAVGKLMQDDKDLSRYLARKEPPGGGSNPLQIAVVARAASAAWHGCQVEAFGHQHSAASYLHSKATMVLSIRLVLCEFPPPHFFPLDIQ